MVPVIKRVRRTFMAACAIYYGGLQTVYAEIPIQTAIRERAEHHVLSVGLCQPFATASVEETLLTLSLKSSYL